MVRSSLSSFVFARFLFSPKLRRASRDTVCTCPKFRRSFVPSLFRGQAWNSSVTEFSNISSIRVRGAIAAYSTNQPVERIGCTLHHFFSLFLEMISAAVYTPQDFFIELRDGAHQQSRFHQNQSWSKDCLEERERKFLWRT